MSNTFNVVRLTRGPHAGKVYVLPCRRYPFKLALVKAEYLLCSANYEAAFWYASGLLRGETKLSHSPYVKAGRSNVWKEAFAEQYTPSWEGSTWEGIH